MTEKTLKIKLEVDVSEGAKISKVVEETVTKMSKLDALEHARLKLIEQQQQAFAVLTTRIDNANRLIEKSSSNSGLAWHNSTIAANKYNEALQRTQEELRKLNTIENANLTLAAGKLPTRLTEAVRLPPEKTFNYATGAVTSRINSYKEYTNNAEALAAHLTRVEREQLRQQEFNIKASHNARQIMYSNLFKEEVAQIPKTTKTVTDNTKALKDNADGADKTGKAHKNLALHIAEIAGIYKLYNITLHGTQEALLNVVKAGIAQQANRSSLLGIFGTEEGNKNLSFIKEIADKAGQSLTVLEQAYARYAPSAILAGAQQQIVNKSFKDFAEVGAILHLSADKVNSLFLALDQMFAKGVVQSEEIKKQLGNVLPGAVEIGAKALEKSPAAFMAAMKNNEVTAKEFVPKFAALYRQIFGGLDDSVFLTVTAQLLSNLRRVENSYTNFNRIVFSKTESIMNSVVKLAANGLDAVSNNIIGIGQALTILGELLAVRLAGMLLVSLGSITTLISKLVTFTTIITGMSAPVLTGVTTLIALYGSLNDLSIKYNTTTGFVVKFHEEEVSLTSYIQATAVTAIDSLKSSFDDLSMSILATPMEQAKTFFSNMIPNADDLAEFKAFVDTMKEAGTSGMKLPDFEALYQQNLAKQKSGEGFQGKIIKKALEIDTNNLIDSFAGQSASKVSEAIAQGRLKTNDEITRALEKTIDIGKPNILAGIENAPIGSGNAIKSLYKDFTRESTKVTKQLEGDLKAQEAAFANNTISITDYYNKKINLIESSFAKQEAILNKELAIAQKAKDIDKINELQDKKELLISDTAQKKAELAQANIVSERQLQTALIETNAKYLEMQGDLHGAAKAHAELNKTNQVAFFEAQQTLAGNKAAAQERSLQKNLVLEQSLKGIYAERAIKTTEYNDALQKINVLYNTGALSQLSSMVEINKLNTQRIKDLQETIDKEKEEILLAGGDNQVTASIRKKAAAARGELAALKAEGNQLAKHFETVVGTAFENSFASVVTGSMNASQAFTAMSTSIQQEIAKIVASELRSSILQPLFKTGLSLLAGAFTGGTSVAAGNSEAFTASMNTSNFWSAQANGGAVTGLAGASGTILNSPTMFQGAKVIPFASGGVLAGEAGAEGVFPLARGRNGKLGIAAIGNNNENSSSIIIQNMVISVQEKENTTSEEQAKMIGETVKAQLKTLIQDQIVTSQRSGGSLNPTSMVASF